MTTETDLTQLLRKGHEAFNDRDRDALLGLIADDAAWNVPGDNPMSGTYRGRDQIWENVFAPMWDAPLRIETHEVISTNKHVTARVELVANLGGEERRFELFETARFEDGKLIGRWSFIDDQSAVDQFIEQAQRQLQSA